MLKQKTNQIIIICCTFILAIFGCIMVYSASKYSATLHYNNPFFYLKKQIIGVVVGAIGLIVCSFVNHKIYKKFYWVFYIVGLIFLCLVFVPGLKRTSYGATRWIGIGSLTMQPSEIAKFCLVFFLAGYLSDGDKLGSFKHVIITLTLGGLYCLLIMLEPNMSITMCVAFTLIFMLFIGGMRLKVFCLLTKKIFIFIILIIKIFFYVLFFLSFNYFLLILRFFVFFLELDKQ